MLRESRTIEERSVNDLVTIEILEVDLDGLGWLATTGAQGIRVKTHGGDRSRYEKKR